MLGKESDGDGVAHCGVVKSAQITIRADLAALLIDRDLASLSMSIRLSEVFKSSGKLLFIL